MKPDSTVVLVVGNPEAVATTEVPAGPDEGVTVTAGAVMVKVPAFTAAVESETCMVCPPGRRFSIMKYPARLP